MAMALCGPAGAQIFEEQTSLQHFLSMAVMVYKRNGVQTHQNGTPAALLRLQGRVRAGVAKWQTQET
jgi:hypothetical protein